MLVHDALSQVPDGRAVGSAKRSTKARLAGGKRKEIVVPVCACTYSSSAVTTNSNPCLEAQIMVGTEGTWKSEMSDMQSEVEHR